MIPLRDLNPTHRWPVFTVGLIVLNAFVFLFEIMLPEGARNQLVYSYGIIPLRVMEDLNLATAVTFLTAMFLHGGFLHILSNMLYLYIFGDNVEDTLGHFFYIVFYLVCGMGASLAQILADPTSPIPSIGASGAIAGVLGAYVVFFPTARVQSLVLLGYFARLVELPALLVLGSWFVLQFFNGVLSLGVSQMGGVAWFAHIGGFVIGLVIAFACKLLGCKPRQPQVIIYPYMRYPPSYTQW